MGSERQQVQFLSPRLIVNKITVTCTHCGKKFSRSTGRANESNKFGWEIYCSLQCLGKSKNHQILLTCSRPGCYKTYFRLRKDLKKSINTYCSQSCAAIVNNSKYVKQPAIIKTCRFCGKNFKTNEKYCSRICKDKSETISGAEISDWIKNFYNHEGRIPFKNECPHNKAARLRLGSWNSAIKLAGFEPNPVKFANKFIANDGHKCDSLAEKIIDDWLFSKKIAHKRTVPYPHERKMTADFVINNYWIEFFGLAGELRGYDKLVRKKLNLVKKNHLKFIQILPKHLFPKNKLKSVLEPIYVK